MQNTRTLALVCALLAPWAWGCDDDVVPPAVLAGERDAGIGVLSPICGNGFIEQGEECDDGNTVSGDNCDSQCRRAPCAPNCGTAARCGDGLIQEGEICDDGNTQSGDGCDAQCRSEVPVCGNGAVEGDEECDDGNIEVGDGCDPNCALEAAPVCGNGLVEAGETCDDGNTVGGDGCSPTCQTEPLDTCGDGFRDPNEECDDGNRVAGDGCDPNCRSEAAPRCGDGTLDPGEGCDDGNNINGDGCDAACRPEAEARCGNGIVDPGEGCDDGNRRAGDGCDANCQPEVVDRCGNGIRDPGEGCDDGNRRNGDGCDQNCQPEAMDRCGNGIRDPGEGCDDGNRRNGDGCDANCQSEAMDRCGNGVRDPGEGCDDGNRRAGDGCDANCQPEAIAACGNGVIEPGEGCDDGNREAGDGCDENCREEQIVPDDDQFEENDLFADATDLEPGAYPALFLAAGDEDWYRVEVCPGGVVTFDVLFAHRDGDVDITAYDANAGRLGGSASATDNEQYVHENDSDAPETIYLRVFGFGRASNTYDLNITVDCVVGCQNDGECAEGEVCEDGACVIAGVPDDRFEENDDFVSAAPLDAGEYPDLRLLAADDDWYAVEVCVGGTLTFDVRFIDADGDIDLTAYDADERRLGGSASSTDDEQYVYVNDGDAPAMIHIRIFGFGNAENDYAVNVALECPERCIADDECPGAVCVEGECLPCREDADCAVGEVCEANACVPAPPMDDRFEENDIFDAATPLAEGEYDDLRMFSRDDDWYRVELCPGGTITFDVLFVDADGDLDVSAYDGNNRRLGGSASSTDNEQVVYTNDSPDPDAVHFRVYGFGGAENEYAVNVAVVCPECVADVNCAVGVCVEQACVECGDNADCDVDEACEDNLCVPAVPADDRFEDNDAQATAAVLPDGAYPNLVAADDDYYRVNVCGGGTVTFDVSFIDADGDLDLVLFDANGIFLGNASSSTDNERLIYENEDALPVDVVLHVFGFGGAVNTYDLDIDIECPEGCIGDAACPDGVCVAGECVACRADADCEAGALCRDNACIPIAALDDEFEENDAQAEAAQVAPGVYADLFLAADDEDWFDVEVCPGGTLTFDVLFVDVDGDLDIATYDSAGFRLRGAASTTDNESLEYTNNGEVPTTVSLQIYGWGAATNTYTLDVTLVCPEGCRGDADCANGERCAAGECVPAEPPAPADDRFEENDDQANARPIAPGQYPGLFAAARDDDWYAVEVCAGGSATFDVLFIDANGDLDISLYSANGLILDSSAGSIDSESIDFTNNDRVPATVYLRVYGWGGASNDYDLNITVECDQGGCFGDGDCPNGVCEAGECVDCRRNADCALGSICVANACVDAPAGDDRFEENDDFADATPLFPGGYPGLFLDRFDDDWYRVELCAGGEITFDVRFRHADGDVDISAYDEGQFVLAGSSSSTDDEQIIYVNNSDQVEEIYLRIFGFGGADNTYTLDIAVDCP